jgi:hypothetical protein
MPSVTYDQALDCVGPGWKSLIDKFYKAVGEDASIHVAQVKEKFGGLRIYFDHCCIVNDTDICNHNYDRLFELVDSLEEQSFKLCEFCGEPGEPRPLRGWVKTMCNACVESEK